MPTLINYNQATFKDHARPNKRRLQELQHTAARAHAARHAYWRKKGVSPPGHEIADGEENQKHNYCSTTSRMKQKSRRVDQRELISPKTIVQTSTSSPCGNTTAIRQDQASSASDSLVPSSHSTESHTPQSPKVDPDTALPHTVRQTKFPADRYTSPKLTRVPPSHVFDPLDSVPIRQEAEVVAAIDHYIYIWAPSQRPGLKYQAKDNPLIRDVFSSALQNVELFEASMALCLSFRAASQNFRTRMCDYSLYHRGRALAGIRTKLVSGAVDEAVILATAFLMIIDNVFLDAHAYKAHLGGLRKMVKAFNLVSSSRWSSVAIMPFISWAEATAEVLFGDATGARTTAMSKPHLIYAIQPFSSTVSAHINSLTPGFKSVALTGAFSLQVLPILAQTIYWTKCIDHDLGMNPSEIDQAFLASFEPRANASELMRLSRMIDEEHMLEQAICMSGYIFYASLLGWTCRCVGHLRVVEELGNTVLRQFKHRDRRDEELWTWLALVTANAARCGSMPILQYQLMATLLEVTGPVHDWTVLRHSMRKFLFHSKLEREWKLCYEMALVNAV